MAMNFAVKMVFISTLLMALFVTSSIAAVYTYLTISDFTSDYPKITYPGISGDFFNPIYPFHFTIASNAMSSLQHKYGIGVLVEVTPILGFTTKITCQLPDSPTSNGVDTVSIPIENEFTSATCSISLYPDPTTTPTDYTRTQLKTKITTTDGTTPTLTDRILLFYPSTIIGCGSLRTGLECKSIIVQHEVQPNTITATPTLSTSLPSIIPLPSATTCDYVINVQGQLEAFSDQHLRMCTGITAKSLIFELYSTTDQRFIDAGIDTSSFTEGIKVCSCECAGYWGNSIETLDNRHCSKCSLSCPDALTPNKDCSACECNTNTCIEAKSYLFSTLYIKPEFLRQIVRPTADITVLQSEMTDAVGFDIIWNPSSNYKAQYQFFMSKFQSKLKTYILQLQSQSTYTTKIIDVDVTSLFEGSFTVYKIALKVKPSTELHLFTSPTYGLITFPKSIATLMIEFMGFELGLPNPNPQFETTLQSYIATITTSTSTPPNQIKWYQTDYFTTKCATYEDHMKLQSNPAYTINYDDLENCPLPLQWVKGNNETETNNFNPLWSPCNANQTFYEYESMMFITMNENTQKIRQIYPQCYDFTGTNVGLYWNVTCGFQSMYYSSTRNTLVMQTYMTNLLQSFSLGSVDLTIVPETQTLARVNEVMTQPMPKFPQFPLVTMVLCYDEIKQCELGYYGPKCDKQLGFSSTSLTASPTTLTPSNHAQITWEYNGDDSHEITLVMKSNNKSNDDDEYKHFVWSQNLGTIPTTYLYNTAQVPSIEQSVLLSTIYSSLKSTEPAAQAFSKIYSASTPITVQGYLTKAPTTLVQLDPTNDINTQFTFKLPMLCTENNVICTTKQQECLEAYGRCRCRAGYTSATIFDLTPPISLDGPPITQKDGSTLKCIPICKNNGVYDTVSQRCQCKDGSYGDYCEILTKCNEKQNDDDFKCGRNGYLVADNNSTCLDICQCQGQFVFGTKNLLQTNENEQKCSYCPLTPFNSEFYTEDELQRIQTIYKDKYPTLEFQLDEKMTQIYQQQHELIPQRCYITGTLNTTYTDGQCKQCQCKKGYGGDYCQLHVAYATFNYSTPIPYHYDPTTELIFFDKFIEELSLSLPQMDKNKIFIEQHNKQEQSIMVGFYTGVDFFTRNNEYKQQAFIFEENMMVNNIQLQKQLQSTPSQSFLTTLSTYFVSQERPTIVNTTLPLSPQINNLYNQWSSLQTNFNNTPIKNQDVNSFTNNSMHQPAMIEDPSCFEQGMDGCSGTPPVVEPPTNKNNNTTLIIAIVVSLVGAAILFIILVCILLWCKRNQRGLWKKEEQRERKKTISSKSVSKSVQLSHTSSQRADYESNPDIVRNNKQSIQAINGQIEIQDATLPAHIKAYRDDKSNKIFYVDSNTMTTSWNHPNAKEEDGGYGDGW